MVIVRATEGAGNVPAGLRAVVFDFDGLILDTEMPMFRAWSEVYEQHGVSLELAAWQTGVGTDSFDPEQHLEQLVGTELDWSGIHSLRSKRRKELLAAEVARPGVVEWLSTAERFGLLVGVASSSPESWLTEHLDRLGLLGQFDCLRGVDSVGEAKPSPASYLSVLESFDVEASQAIAVEDSAHGVAAAKAAGLFCVAVPHALCAGLDFAAADIVIDRLDELDLGELLGRFEP